MPINRSKNTQQVADVVEPVDVDAVEQKEVRLGLPRPDWFTGKQLKQWLPFVLVILLGAALRFWQLGIKPLHHDESLHAYYSLQLLRNLQNWRSCFDQKVVCYHYDPLLHGPFQFHIIAFVYQCCQWLGVSEHGVNTTTVRIAAATLGTVIVGLPYLIRDYLGGRRAAWLACFLLAISPSMVYFSRFAREDIYMACFTLLLVVAAGRYMRSRQRNWLLVGAVAFILSYATKEATFLSIAVFGSFLLGVLVWEIGSRIPVRTRFRSDSALGLYAPKTAAPLCLVLLVIYCAPLAKWLFSWMRDTSIYINTNTAASDAIINTIKSQTLTVLPWLGLGIGIYVLFRWGSEHFQKKSATGRKGLAARVDPLTQPTLDALVTMPWQHWFGALIAAGSIFVLLFSVVFTNFPKGIGDGIWQGLYYWLQQQQIARGSQPWYYYLLLIPLYEQIGVVFSLAGVFHCLRHPDRFRLFLLYWCAGTIGIYSWAGEKMPWLMIHMTMPMMLLAAIGLEPLFIRLSALVKNGQILTHKGRNKVQSKRGIGLPVGTVSGALAAIFLLILTLQNMLQVTFVHYADGPHEMMIYVQTTTDVPTVMNKIDQLDEKLYHGQHKLNIGVMTDASWPFYWYLRDYPNVCYGFPTGCADSNPEAIITGSDNLIKSQAQYSTSDTSGHTAGYLFHRYHLRTWWDEGYKPKPCVPGATNSCQGQPTWGGVGPLLWLSYGDTPPDGALFNPPLAFKNIWDWWWTRKPFGSIDGATDMGFFIRSDME
ncbi:flippase activity-associated protein Agl23 [Dictyobacter kobayashii]|uniref:Glycosyltransferase RgtA/B/C/D-like domain-containing protein n=1 Tax=Dictyobacter kobayashii TaxID=2014872 RepID=A0A402AEF7_9CHLR|nr:flippase activity-associated protein Agl23 [Dictyobacter kobayashii]GCE17464.1 hypothetical protein KDK_12640 [Dictyobacter kobayashii]